MTKMVVKKKNTGSIRSIFMHADGVDILLMIMGLIGTIGDGFSMPVMLFATSKLMNDIGYTSTGVDAQFTHSINKVSLYILVYAYMYILAYVLNYQFS